MKPYDSDEELDRALFALALEEPPAGLRASILAATICRAPEPAAPWEVWLFGALCALLVWLLVAVAHGADASAAAAGTGYLTAGIDAIVRPPTLFWIALGGSAAFWVSQLNLTFVPQAIPAGRR